MDSYTEPIPNIPTLAPTNIYNEAVQPMRDQLDRIYTDTANIVNDKSRREQYLTTEDISTDTWVEPDPQGNPNPVFKMTIATGAIMVPGTTTIPHGIDDFGVLVNARGMVTNNVGNNRFLPYSSPTAANSASIDVDATNIYITTGAGFGALYTGYVILEYTKAN